MQEHLTRKTEPAGLANGGAAVETGPIGPTRPTATGRITHPHTPRLARLSAVIATSEQQRAALRAQLAQLGVAR